MKTYKRYLKLYQFLVKIYKYLSFCVIGVIILIYFKVAFAALLQHISH